MSATDPKQTSWLEADIVARAASLGALDGRAISSFDILVLQIAPTQQEAQQNIHLAHGLEKTVSYRATKSVRIR